MKQGSDSVDHNNEKDIFFYEVDEFKTIVEPGIRVPTCYNDIFGQEIRNLDDIENSEDFICEVEYIHLLRSHFQFLADGERERLVKALDSPGDFKDKADRQCAKRLAKAMEGDGGWKAWISSKGRNRLPIFKKVIEDWLAAPIDFTQEAYFPTDWNGVGSAKKFFESLDSDINEHLGVFFVEGEHPASTYYAVTLNKPIEEANKEAEKLGLSFRFRSTSGQV